MVHAVLQKILTDDVDYSTAIGADPEGGIRLYPNVAPQRVRYPYATTQIISRVEQQNKDARGLITYMVQINQVSKSVAEATYLDSLCIAALNRYKGEVNGVKVSSIRVVGGGGDFAEPHEDMPLYSEFSVKVNP